MYNKEIFALKFLMLVSKNKMASYQHGKYYFPYHLFLKNEKVLLYGTGDVGVNLYFQALRNGFVEIVGILDKNAEKLATDVLLVKMVTSVFTTVYDKILITIKDESVARLVKNDLMCMGIDGGYIVWDGKTYDRDKFERCVCFPMMGNLGV